MRMGEINALKLDSIDFENNVVHVNVLGSGDFNHSESGENRQ